MKRVFRPIHPDSTPAVKKTEGMTALYLKETRMALGIPKGRLARMAGVKRTTIIMMEQSLACPKFDFTYAMLKAMGKTVTDLEDFYASKGMAIA